MMLSQLTGHDCGRNFARRDGDSTALANSLPVLTQAADFLLLVDLGGPEVVVV